MTVSCPPPRAVSTSSFSLVYFALRFTRLCNFNDHRNPLFDRLIEHAVIHIANVTQTLMVFGCIKAYAKAHTLHTHAHTHTLHSCSEDLFEDNKGTCYSLLSDAGKI